MKKVLIAAILALSMMSHARADTLSQITGSFNPEPGSTAALASVGVASGAALAFGGAAAGPFAIVAFGGTGLMYVIASGFDPWTPVFPVVDYTYPRNARRI